MCTFSVLSHVLRATGSSELVDDFHQLFAESDGVALLDEDDAVEAVADEEETGREQCPADCRQ